MVPGGYGAAGAPNDGFHQYLHLFNRSYSQLAVGYGNCLELRKRLDQLSMGVQGSVSTKLPGRSFIKCHVLTVLRFPAQGLAVDIVYRKYILIHSKKAQDVFSGTDTRAEWACLQGALHWSLCVQMHMRSSP